MTSTIWTSTITQIGPDAPMMFESGVYILFGEPVPESLAEVSLVHRSESGTGEGPDRDGPQVGDSFVIGSDAVEITEVGELAGKNLHELGHIVVYLNAQDQKLLPGAVKATGALPEPRVGDRLALTRG